jgi:phage terminase large subunit
MWLPHDGDHKDYKTGKTPKEIASNLGFNVGIVEKIDKGSQIKAARLLFSRCWFDQEKCQRGIDALASWHFDWDEKLRILSTLPVHDWASHGGDAFCQIALKHEDQVEWRKPDAYGKKRKQHRSWMAA